MTTYRMSMLEKIWIVNFRGMIGLLTQEYNKGQEIKHSFSNGTTLTIRCSQDTQLSIFDIAVMHAIHSIFIEKDEISRFKPLHILKILTGNNKAHFCKNKVKNKTIDEKEIIKSIKKLSMVNILEINKQKLISWKLVDLEVINDYFELKNKPALLYIVENQLLDGVSLNVYPISAMHMKNKNAKHNIHQTKNVIEFKFFIIHNILCSKEATVIPNKQIKEFLGINNQIMINRQKYKDKLISYDIYRKTNIFINRQFRLNLIVFLNILTSSDVIKGFEIFNDVTKIYQ